MSTCGSWFLLHGCILAAVTAAGHVLATTSRAFLDSTTDHVQLPYGNSAVSTGFWSLIDTNTHRAIGFVKGTSSGSANVARALKEKAPVPVTLGTIGDQ
jgi:hypothetical protein